MKATGIIRRIDDLGRVVIPKEIRRTMRICEGDALEIYVTDKGIMLQKYDETVQRETEAQMWLVRNKQKMDAQYVRFSIDGRLTTCEGIRDGRRVTGSTMQNPNDVFNPSVGMVYAYCRAFGIAIPDELR